MMKSDSTSHQLLGLSQMTIIETKNLITLCVSCQAAKTKQRIKEEQMQIRVVERSQQIQVQEQEIIRRERELDATIRKPAEAEKFRLEKIAEANR